MKNDGILDFQCVGDFLSLRQKQMNFSNVPDTSRICPGCLGELSSDTLAVSQLRRHGSILLNPCLSALFYKNRYWGLVTVLGFLYERVRCHAPTSKHSVTSPIAHSNRQHFPESSRWRCGIFRMNADSHRFLDLFV